jgi:hypothetical protein
MADLSLKGTSNRNCDLSQMRRDQRTNTVRLPSMPFFAVLLCRPIQSPRGITGPRNVAPRTVSFPLILVASRA